MYDVWVNLQSEATHQTEATCAKRTQTRISLSGCQQQNLVGLANRAQFSCALSSYCIIPNVERIKPTLLQLCVSRDGLVRSYGARKRNEQLHGSEGVTLIGAISWVIVRPKGIVRFSRIRQKQVSNRVCFLHSQDWGVFRRRNYFSYH